MQEKPTLSESQTHFPDISLNIAAPNVLFQDPEQQSPAGPNDNIGRVNDLGAKTRDLLLEPLTGKAAFDGDGIFFPDGPEGPAGLKYHGPAFDAFTNNDWELFVTCAVSDFTRNANIVTFQSKNHKGRITVRCIAKGGFRVEVRDRENNIIAVQDAMPSTRMDGKKATIGVRCYSQFVDISINGLLVEIEKPFDLGSAEKHYDILTINGVMGKTIKSSDELRFYGMELFGDAS